jgi:hypothetical protein
VNEGANDDMNAATRTNTPFTSAMRTKAPSTGWPRASWGIRVLVCGGVVDDRARHLLHFGQWREAKSSYYDEGRREVARRQRGAR